MKSKKSKGCSTAKFPEMFETVSQLVDYMRTNRNKFIKKTDFMDLMKSSFVQELDNYNDEQYEKILLKAYYYAKGGSSSSLIMDDINTDFSKYFDVHYFNMRISSEKTRNEIIKEVHNEILEAFRSFNDDENVRTAGIDGQLNNYLQERKLEILNNGILPYVNGVRKKHYDSMDEFANSDDYILVKKLWCYDYEKASQLDNYVDNFFESGAYNIPTNIPYSPENKFFVTGKSDVQKFIGTLLCYDSIIHKELHASFISTKRHDFVNSEYYLKGKSLFKSNYFEDNPHQYLREVNHVFEFFLSGIKYSPIYYANDTDNNGVVGSSVKMLSTTALSSAWVDVSNVIEENRDMVINKRTGLTLGKYFSMATSGNTNNLTDFIRMMFGKDEKTGRDRSTCILNKISDADNRGVLRAIADSLRENSNVIFGRYDLNSEICRLLRETDALPLLQKNLDNSHNSRGNIERMKRMGFKGMYELRNALTSNYGRLNSLDELLEGTGATVTINHDAGSLKSFNIQSKANKGYSWSLMFDMEKDNKNQYKITLNLKYYDPITGIEQSKIIPDFNYLITERDKAKTDSQKQAFYLNNNENYKPMLHEIEHTLNTISSYAFGKNMEYFSNENNMSTIDGAYTEYQKLMGYQKMDMKLHRLSLIGLGVWIQSNLVMEPNFHYKPKNLRYRMFNAFGDGYQCNPNPGNRMKALALPSPKTNLKLSSDAQDIFEADTKFDRGLTASVTSNSGKRLDEQHIHSVATSAYRVWDNYRSSEQSPSRYNFLFRFGIFKGMNKFSEIQYNGQSTDIRKLSKADMFMLFYVNGLLDNPQTYRAEDGFNNGYFMPITMADKNFIPAAEYDEKKLIDLSYTINSSLASEVEYFISGNSSKTIYEILNSYKNLSITSHVSTNKINTNDTANVMKNLSRAFKVLRFLDNAMYYAEQEFQVHKDFVILGKYFPEISQSRGNINGITYSAKELYSMAKEYNNDRLLRHKYRTLYDTCSNVGDFDALIQFYDRFGLNCVNQDGTIMTPSQYDEMIYDVMSSNEELMLPEIDIVAGLHTSKTNLREKLLCLHGLYSDTERLYTQYYHEYVDGNISEEFLADFVKKAKIEYMYRKDDRIEPFLHPSYFEYDYDRYDDTNKILSVHNLLNFGVVLNKKNLRGFDSKTKSATATKMNNEINNTWNIFKSLGGEWIDNNDVVLFKIGIESIGANPNEKKVEFINITNKNQMSYLKIVDSNVLETIESGQLSYSDFSEVIVDDNVYLKDKFGSIIKTATITYGNEWNQNDFIKYIQTIRKKKIYIDKNNHINITLNPVLDMLRTKQSMLVDAYRNCVAGQSFQFDKTENNAFIPLAGIDINNENRNGVFEDEPELDIILGLEGCENTEQKRMTLQSAPEHLYSAGLYGVPVIEGSPVVNEAVITDNESNVNLYYGDKYKIVTDNGVVYVDPIFNWMLMNSSGIDGSDNVSSKPYVSAFLERYGLSFPNKCAFMSLSNSSMANSKEHRMMFKNMNSLDFDYTIDKLIANRSIKLSPQQMNSIKDFDWTETLSSYEGYCHFTFDENVYEDYDGTDAYLNIVDVKKVGYRTYEIVWGDKSNSSINGVAVTNAKTVVINSVNDIYEALGGINSFRKTRKGFVRSDDSISHTAKSICDADYSIGIADNDGTTGLKYTEIFKSSITHLCATREAVKYSQSNINEREDICHKDSEGKLNTVTTTFNDAGKQGNFAHVSEDDEEISLMTQIIYVCTGMGSMSKNADEIQKALGQKMNALVKRYSEVLLGTNVGDDANPVYQTDIDAIKSAIVVDIAKYLKENKGRDVGTMQDMMIESFVKYGKKMNISDISFIRDNDFHNLVIDLAAMINKECVRIKMNGKQNVLLPSDGMIRMHFGQMMSKLGADAEEIGDSLYNMQIAANGQTNPNAIILGQPCYVVDMLGNIVSFVPELSETSKTAIIGNHTSGMRYFTSLDYFGEMEIGGINECLNGIKYTIEFKDGHSHEYIMDDTVRSLIDPNSVSSIKINQYKEKSIHYDTHDLYVGETYYKIDEKGNSTLVTINTISDFYSIKKNHRNGFIYVDAAIDINDNTHQTTIGRDLRCDLYTFSFNGKHYSTWDLESIYYSCALKDSEHDSSKFNDDYVSLDRAVDFLKKRNDLTEPVLSWSQIEQLRGYQEMSPDDKLAYREKYRNYVYALLRRAVNNDLSAIKNGSSVNVYDFETHTSISIPTAEGYKYYPAECIMNTQYEDPLVIDDETGEETLKSPDMVFGRYDKGCPGFFDAEIITTNNRTVLVATRSTLNEYLSLHKTDDGSSNLSAEFSKKDVVDFEYTTFNRIKIFKSEHTFKVGSTETNYYVMVYNPNTNESSKYPIIITDDANSIDTSTIANINCGDGNPNATLELARKVNINKHNIIDSIKVTREKIREVFCSRTPAQSKQSGMVMRVVDYHDDQYNNVYVSKLQLLFHGSDFDIDKIFQLLYTVNGGIIDFWSVFAKSNTETNMKLSMRLPMPDPELSNKSVDSVVMDVNNNPNAISGSSFISDLNSFFDSDDMIEKSAKQILTEVAGEKLALLVNMFDIIGRNNNTIPVDGKVPGDVIKARKMAEILIEYNKPENYNDNGLNNFIMSRIVNVFTDLDSYQEIANPLDSQTVLKNIKAKNSALRESGLISTGVIGSEICKTFDTQAGKDSVGIGANGNKALYAAMTASLKAAASKNNDEINNVKFSKVLNIPDGNGGFKKVEFCSIVGSPVLLLSDTDFIDKDNVDWIDQCYGEYAAGVKKVYNDCKQNMGDRIDFMYAVMCYRSTLSESNKRGFDEMTKILLTHSNNYNTNEATISQYIQNSLLHSLKNADSAYWNSFKNISVVSEFISAAVDNAKEGILNILNAGTNMMNMYTYGLAIGVDIEKLNEIMTSNIARELNSLANGNMYNGDESKRVDKIMEDLDKIPFPPKILNEIVVSSIIDYRNLKSKKERGKKMTVQEAMEDDGFLNKNIETILKFSSLDGFYRTLHDTAKTNRQIIKNYDVESAIDNYINRIKKYVSFKNLKTNNTDMFYNIYELNNGATEMKKMTDLLKPAMGINVLPSDNDSYFIKFNNLFEDEKNQMIVGAITEANQGLMQRHPDYFQNGDTIEDNSIRLEFIAIDEKYLDDLISIYNLKKDTFNIFYVLKSNENYLTAIKAQCVHHLAMYKLSKRYPAVQYCKNYIMTKNKYAIKSSVADKKVGEFIETAYVNEFLKRTAPIVIPAGTTISVGRLDEGYKLHNDMPILLGSNYGNSYFKNYIENHFFRNLKRNGYFVNNKGKTVMTDFGKFIGQASESLFIRDIQIDKYSLNIQFANADTDIKMKCIEAFEDIRSQLTDIQDSTGKYLTVHEVITAYNYVVNRGSNSLSSFTGLLSRVKPGVEGNIYDSTYTSIIDSVVGEFDYKSKHFLNLLLKETAPVLENIGAANAYDKESFWYHDDVTGEYKYYVDARPFKPKTEDEYSAYYEMMDNDPEQFMENNDIDAGIDDYEYEDFQDPDEDDYSEPEYKKTDYVESKFSFFELSPYGFYCPYITETSFGLQFYDPETKVLFTYNNRPSNHSLAEIRYGNEIFDVSNDQFVIDTDNGPKTIDINPNLALQYFPDGSIIPNFAVMSKFVKERIDQERNPLNCK